MCYLSRNVSKFYRDIYSCLENNRCEKKNYGNDVSKTFVSAREVAALIVENIGKTNENISPILKKYTRDQIWNYLLNFKVQKLSSKNDLFYVFSNWNEEIINKYSRVFYSQVYSLTNKGHFIKKAQNTLFLIEKLLEEFPDFSSEYIQFWVKKDDNASFFEIFTVGEEIKKRLHVIEVWPEDFVIIKKVLNLTDSDFPEYFFRDIGIRFCQGEVIFTGNEDIYPSPNLIDVMHKKSISPFAILRSGLRESSESSPKDVFDKFHYSVDPPSMRIDTQKNFTFLDHSIFASDEVSDPQGA